MSPRCGASSWTGFAGVDSGDPQAAAIANTTHKTIFEICFLNIPAPGNRLSSEKLILPDMRDQVTRAAATRSETLSPSLNSRAMLAPLTR
jgi:hypothetical protein